jgi:hypothetical protein
MRLRGAGPALAVLAGAFPPGALAHAFGERYDLPAPLGYFVAGAAATVALSFAVAVVAVRRARPRPDAARSIDAAALLAVLRAAVRCIALALFLLVIAAGLWGDAHPAKNIAPTLVWILGWVGLSLCVALVANVWPAVDPWRTLHALLPAREPRAWPAPWGSKPAVLLFLVFAWLEVVDPVASRPAHIAVVLLAWTAVNLSGMRVFGREAWQANADPLAIYFETLGRFAPLAARDGRLVVRPWARALVEGTPPAPKAFVIAMLSTVLFDGLLGTQAWRKVDTAFSTWAPGWNDRDGVLLGTAGLLVTWAVFLAAYRGACALTAAMAGVHATSRVATLFAPTLVPIAVAYLVAHNLSYLLVQGQGVVPLLSDPFGRGWNLFGTAGFTPDIGVIDAKKMWHIATAAIVAGHVVAVWLAHRVALAEWPTARGAVLASAPLTIVMVAYTAVSLTVIAEPLTRYRTPDPGYTVAPQCDNKA